jgi:hypothetical protein
MVVGQCDEKIRCGGRGQAEEASPRRRNLLRESGNVFEHRLQQRSSIVPASFQHHRILRCDVDAVGRQGRGRTRRRHIQRSIRPA